MRKLYVIGNGFDLHHGLETSYLSFGLFLKNNYSTIYWHLTEYYGFSDICNENVNEHALWSEFEKSLALLDPDTVLEAHSDSLARPGSPEFRDRDWGAFAIDIEMIVEELTVNLFKAFKEFILQIRYLDIFCIKSKVLLLDKESLYLTFNYTDTLERYYDIPEKNILYLHEKASQDEKVLILGHGIEPDNFKEKEATPPEGASAEEYQQWIEYMGDNYDHSYELGKNELFNYFNDSFKQTKNIIKNNQSFFNSLKNINEVIIIGHSLSEVDLPYFTKIQESVKRNAIWYVTYHHASKKTEHEQSLINLKVESKYINPLEINDLVATDA